MHDYQRSYEELTLKTRSRNHIIVDKGEPIKRYVKTIIAGLSLRRLDIIEYDLTGKKSYIDVVLITSMDDSAAPYIDEDNKYIYSDIPFKYTDNVVELYGAEDVRVFELINRLSIDKGDIVEYDPSVNYVYDIVGYNDNSRPIYRLTEKAKQIDTIVRKYAKVTK